MKCFFTILLCFGCLQLTKSQHNDSVHLELDNDTDFNLPFFEEDVSLLNSTTVFAQQGASWYYSSFVLFPYPDLHKFVADGEIMLNDTLATVLKFYTSEGGGLHVVDSLEKYVFTAGDKVYYWVQDAFYLLFDFGASIGDTIHSRAEDFPVSLGCYSDFSQGTIPFSYVIDTISIMNFGGQDLRIQSVTHIDPQTQDPVWVMEGTIVERMGQIYSPGFWWGRGNGCLLGGFPGELRCYEDEEMYYKNPFTHFNLPCDFTSSTAPVIVDANPIYPNPTSDEIFLPATAALVEVYNVTGHRVLSKTDQNSIEVKGLVPGIYFLRYQVGNNWIVDKFVKQ